MDEVTISAEHEVPPLTRVHLSRAGALTLGLVVGLFVGVAVAAALTSVAKTYGDDTTPAEQIVVEEDEPEASFVVVEE